MTTSFPRHVVIIGNGIYKNGWCGVCRSFVTNNPFYDSEDDIISNLFSGSHLEAALSMAAMRRKYILLNLNEYLRCVGKKSRIESVPFELQSGLIERFNKWEDALVKNHQQPFSIHENIELILKLLNDSEIGIITTNWNASIKNYLDKRAPIFLHGCADEDESLILPTEFALDGKFLEELMPYGRGLGGENQIATTSLLHRAAESIQMNEDGDLGSIKDSLFNSIDRFLKRYLRSHIKARHSEALDWIESCETISLIGIELHTYDAELSHLLMFRGLKKKVCIVNEKENNSNYVKSVKAILHPSSIDYFNCSDLGSEAQFAKLHRFFHDNHKLEECTSALAVYFKKRSLPDPTAILAKT